MAKHDTQSDHKSAGLKSWLDNLQQESWQLELLISGFTIFLLIGGWGPVADLEYDLIVLKGTATGANSMSFLYHVLRTAYLSLLACLLIHVVLRGVWIAAIGLRSVSGEIDYDQLHYQPRFVDRLRRRLGSFDDYIERMEVQCSFTSTPYESNKGCCMTSPSMILPRGRHTLRFEDYKTILIG